tara:strand:+ start:58 stop:504 length:447 start_codon:yes stop_codon:yes gene_type:complete
MSMVRDLYSGRSMARIMSISMSIFILVPTLAPALGQAIMLLVGWRYIFGTFIGFGVLGLFWLLIRQPETLADEHRRPMQLATLVSGFVTVYRSRAALGYSLAIGTMFGAFIGFLEFSPADLSGYFRRWKMVSLPVCDTGPFPGRRVTS